MRKRWRAVIAGLIGFGLAGCGPESEETVQHDSAPAAAAAAESSQAGQTEAEPAGNRAEQRALAYVETLNEGSAENYEAYMQENRTAAALARSTPAARREQFDSLRNRFGKLYVAGVMQPSDAEIRVLVETGIGEKMEIIFTIAVGAEAKIDTIDFQPFGRQIDIDPDWRDLDSLVSAYTGPSGVPAWAIAVIKDGEIVDLAAKGVKSLGQDDPVDPATSQFHWGSVVKSVTGTVIGALVEDGLIGWDTTLGEVFDNEDILDAYKPVTIAQLMAHESGVPQYTDFSPEMVEGLKQKYSGPLQTRRRNFALDILKNEAPIYDPGTDQRYSNAGITVAGVVAETVSGKSWEDLVTTHVFNAFGMQNAGFGWPGGDGRKGQTSGHFGMQPEEAEIAPDDAMLEIVELLAPAGNVRSTIGDFARYAAAHLNGLDGKSGALTADTIKRLHTPGPAPAGMPYSFGWGIETAPDGAPMHWHNGSAGTYYAEVRLFPEDNFGIVIMANAAYAETMVRPLWEAIYQRYTAEE